MAEVIGTGAALSDTLMAAEEFPKEDIRMQRSSTKLQYGGPYAVALVTVSELGISAKYMGTLGDDMYGGFIRREFARLGVGCDSVRTVEGGQSSHSFVLTSMEKSTRACIRNRGMLLPPEAGDVDLETPSGTKYLHLDGHHPEATIHAAGKAGAQGVKASPDAGGTYPGIEKLLPLVGVLTSSEEFALVVTRERKAEKAAVALMERYHPEILVVIQGDRGGLIREKGQTVRYPVYPVKAIDTNEAGNMSHGAFLVGRTREMTVYEAALFALAVLALKCTRFGAQDGIPGHEETMEFMETNKRR